MTTDFCIANLRTPFIKMNHLEFGSGEGGFGLHARPRIESVRWGALVNAVINLRVS